jgi:hypothetical protein
MNIFQRFCRRFTALFERSAAYKVKEINRGANVRATYITSMDAETGKYIFIPW